MRKLLYILTVLGLLAFTVSAQQSGGSFLPAADYSVTGAWTFATAPTITSAGTIVSTTATQTLTNKTLTAPTVTAPAITGAATMGAGATLTQPAVVELSEIVTATNVLTAAESGKTFYLSAVAGFLTTLPAPAIGLHFKFVVKTAPTSNGYTIGTPTDNIGFGMVVERAGGAGVACASEDLLTLVANQAIVGDWLEVRSDGTNWYLHGMVDVAAGFTCGAT